MDLKVFYQKEISDLDKDLKSDFEHLILETLQINKLDLHSGQIELSDTDIYLLRARIKDLKNNVPLAYILESQNFMGLDFYVDERVLIPRSETEYLVDYCLKQTDLETLNVFDAGAGSGCIGVSYLVLRPKSFCTFMEKSDKAIEVLKKNLEIHNISKDRFQIVKDFEEFERLTPKKNQSLDLFISNPPYIAKTDERVESSVLKHEPSMALFADDEGFLYLKSWALKALSYLSEKGQFAIFEFGLGQESELQSFAEAHQLQSEIIKDQYGSDRFWKVIK